MRDWFWKHRALTGYLFLLAIVLIALELHQHAVTRDFAESDRRSCEQRQVLASNQAFVLRALSSTLRAEIHDPDESIPAGLIPVLLANLDEAERRLAEQNPIKPC